MNTKHGCGRRSSQTPEYKAWRKMRARCKYPGLKNKSYFAKGIKVCERWQDFANFLSDMGLKPTARHSLNRIDNNQGYFPANCNWATRGEQDRNKTTNVFIEFNGRHYCQKDFAEIFGVTDATIIAKFHQGMSVAEIVDYYEAKHNKKYRKKTSSFMEALTSLGYSFNKERPSFFKLGDMVKHV